MTEYRKYPDNCERCSGTRGGVCGNENRVDGRVLCDYCSCAPEGCYDIKCLDCFLPLSEHALLTGVEINNLWEQGIGVPICREQHLASEVSGLTLVLLGENIKAPGEPDDPCDEDFMKEISS